MPSLEPYQALFFFVADDIDEVNREYKQAYDDGGFLTRYRDQSFDLVTVVGCEQEAGMTFVYFLRNGLLERGYSWQVRKHT